MSESVPNVPNNDDVQHEVDPVGAEEEVTPPVETGGDDPIQLPDDHPLVKSLAAQKEQIRQLKDRTKKLDELEQEQMSDAEKSAARIKAAEDRASELEAANDRKDVVIEFGLSVDDAELLDGMTDIEAMKKIAKRLADKQTTHDKRPHPAQQGNGDTPPDSKDALAREFFGLNP